LNAESQDKELFFDNLSELEWWSGGVVESWGFRMVEDAGPEVGVPVEQGGKRR